MANRQYIGARYVPKLVGDWQADTFYEALSIVTSNNVSYTSKKPVPPTVGIPAENPEYWVATGNYNAQVAQYAEQVASYKEDVDNVETQMTELSTSVDERLEVVEEEISNLEKLNMILITDSYGIQNSGGSVTTFFPTLIKNHLGLDNNHFRYSAQSGAGFGDGEFLSQLQTIAGGMSAEEKSAVTDILVCGGWNDSDKTQSYGTDEAYNTGIDDFDTYIKTTFPNARMNLAMISWGDSKISGAFTAPSQMGVALSRYVNSASEKNWRFLKNCEYILHTYEAGIWQADGNHPSQGGQNLLGKYIAAAFKNGVIDIFREEKIPSICSGYDCFIKQHNEITQLTIIPQNNNNPFVEFRQNAVSLNGGDEHELLDASSSYILRLAGGYARINSMCQITSGDASNTVIPSQMSLEGHTNGKIFARFIGNQYGVSADTIYIWWLGGSFALSTMNC